MARDRSKGPAGGGGAAKGRGADGRGGAGDGGARDGGGGKGSAREDRVLASQLDVSKSLPGSGVGGLATGDKSLGRMISDLFGGPAAYANNPNRPKYNTKTMGVPVNMSWSNVPFGPNYGMPNPLGIGIGLMNMGSSGIGLGMAATRAMQAATGMSGGPAIGGRSDGMGAFGGGGGTSQGMNSDGSANKLGYQLSQGYMQQQQQPIPLGQSPVTPPAQPTYNMLNQPSMFLSPAKGYGVNTPAYSYFGPMKL